MHDSREGKTPAGTIRTGADRRAVDPAYEPVLRAALDAVAGSGSLYVYGSVATGCAVVPSSDVDLLSIGLTADDASRTSTELSARFADRCREVSVAPASWEQLGTDTDEAYGLRVFLRHYCVHLGGDDPASGLPAYPADARAARGFNGDIGQHLQRWRREADGDPDVTRLATRISRKTLLAVAGLVSVRDDTWSTDRRACAARWDELEPDASVATLVSWLDSPPQDPAAIRRALEGPVAEVVEAFRSEIGLWVAADP